MIKNFVGTDRKQLELKIDQKPMTSIELEDIVGVHYDRHKECTNIVLQDSKLIVFKGF